MFRIVETAWIGEVGISASQGFCFGIHQFSERLNTSGAVLCQCIGNLVGGLQQKGVEAISHAHLVTDAGTDDGSARFQSVDCCVAESYDLVHVTVFQCNQGGENLCDTGRVVRFVDVLSV